ncbi:MAG: hypothetical protein NC310_08875 [Roseburia sp.]|nr:hypothetical protein [Anaeroplasma bactoclasticum]MCM1197161.1 hypothetical protein [Roseburia sp.]MCM1557616.1 hypothetical protein [Anaeroplasma bactoclasticum]
MKRKGILFLICMFFLFLFSSCGENKYDAVMHSHAEEWISKEFLKENASEGILS